MKESEGCALDSTSLQFHIIYQAVYGRSQWSAAGAMMLGGLMGYMSARSKPN